MEHSILMDDEQCTWKVQARSGRMVESIKTLREFYHLGFHDAKLYHDWYCGVVKLRGRTIPDAAPVVADEPAKYFIKLSDDTFIRVTRNVSTDDCARAGFGYYRVEKVKAYVVNGNEELLKLISDLSNA